MSHKCFNPEGKSYEELREHYKFVEHCNNVERRQAGLEHRTAHLQPIPEGFGRRYAKVDLSKVTEIAKECLKDLKEKKENETTNN